MKTAHFDRNFITERDILLHEIAHIVVSEYYKIPVLRLHFDPPNSIHKIDTDDPKGEFIKNKILSGTPPKRYKRDLQKRFHIRLAGEVFVHACDYDFELDMCDINAIQNTPEGQQVINMSSNMFNFNKLAYETLKILKKRTERINYLYEILLHETAKSKIVKIPPPEQQATIHQYFYCKMIQLFRSLFQKHRANEP